MAFDTSEEERAAVLRAQEVLAARGFLPFCWFHPETGLMVEAARSAEPFFRIMAPAPGEDQSHVRTEDLAARVDALAAPPGEG